MINDEQRNHEAPYRGFEQGPIRRRAKHLLVDSRHPQLSLESVRVLSGLQGNRNFPCGRWNMCFEMSTMSTPMRALRGMASDGRRISREMLTDITPDWMRRSGLRLTGGELFAAGMESIFLQDANSLDHQARKPAAYFLEHLMTCFSLDPADYFQCKVLHGWPDF
ncbi:MAG: hypothetical protein R2861_03570 [Desulfobacterales bacterium]